MKEEEIEYIDKNTINKQDKFQTLLNQWNANYKTILLYQLSVIMSSRKENYGSLPENEWPYNICSTIYFHSLLKLDKSHRKGRFYPEKYENPWELKEKIKIEEYALFMNIRYNIIISFLQIIYKFNVNTIKIVSESLSQEFRGYFLSLYGCTKN